MIKWLCRQIRLEPVAFQAVVQAGLALGIAFGFTISEKALGAILAFSAALLSFFTRTQVTSLERPRDAGGRSLVPV